MSSRSKQKGAAFEREICTRLSEWITRGAKADCFWRSAMSGGRATFGARTKGEHHSRQAGDICSVSPEGHVLTDQFYIELKHVKDLQIDRLLERTGALYRFWDIARIEAARYDKRPMLIAKQNNMPILLLLEEHGIACLIKEAKGLDSLTLSKDGHLELDTNVWLFDAVLRRRFRR